MKLFVFGLGYSALALARALQAEGWQIGGTTRSAENETGSFSAEAGRSERRAFEEYTVTPVRRSTAIAAALPGSSPPTARCSWWTSTAACPTAECIRSCPEPAASLSVRLMEWRGSAIR